MDILGGGLVGRPAQKIGKPFDVADIVVLGPGAKPADRHVLDQSHYCGSFDTRMVLGGGSKHAGIYSGAAKVGFPSEPFAFNGEIRSRAFAMRLLTLLRSGD